MERAGVYCMLAASTVWAAMLCPPAPLAYTSALDSSLEYRWYAHSLCAFTDHSLDAHHCFAHQDVQGEEMKSPAMMR